MAEKSLGFFGVTIGAKTDAQSFQRAQQGLENLQKAAESGARGIENAFKSIIGVTTKTTAALVGFATTTSIVESSELRLSKAMGVSVGQLDQYKTALGIAGVNAGNLTSSLTNLENKMQRIKLGEVDTGLVRSLGMLGMDYSDFAKMSNDQRLRSVFARAGGMQDQGKAAQLVSDVLGSGAREYYDYLKLSGKTLDEQLAMSKRLIFTDENSKRKAMEFHAEIKGLYASVKSITALVGSELAGAITPIVSTLKETIAANKELIQTGITGFIKGTTDALTRLMGQAARFRPAIERIIRSLGGIDQIIIKIGLGIATLKVGGAIAGIAKLVQSLGSLKTIIAGLGFTALYLLMDDVVGYFQGKDSMLGYIIDNFSQVSEKLKIDGFVNLAKALGDLVKNITGADSVKAGLEKIAEGLGKIAVGSLEMAIKLMGDLASLVANLISGDWDKIGVNIGKFFSDWAEGMKKIFNLDEAGSATASSYSERIENGENPVSAADHALYDGAQKTPFGPALKWGHNITSGAINAIKEAWKGETYPMQDGIVRPNGQVVQVAPDDWVFAARNLGDMASAFVPRGMQNITNNSAASSNVVVTQNFTINGGADSRTAQTIRQQAYNGVRQGLAENMKGSINRLQLMQGAR